MRKAFFCLALAAAWASAAAEETRFGHRRYPEAGAQELSDIGFYRQSGRKVKLRPEAAAAFADMTKAARAQGVKIIPISGFRPASYQTQLFQRALRRYGSEEKAARWVAPPGFSEHHTGWTLDLGDEKTPAADVEVAFENTETFLWLKDQAADFGFELSFPKGNAQGVSYEPWHWRYIGAPQSKALFHPE